MEWPGAPGPPTPTRPRSHLGERMPPPLFLGQSDPAEWAAKASPARPRALLGPGLTIRTSHAWAGEGGGATTPPSPGTPGGEEVRGSCAGGGQAWAGTGEKKERQREKGCVCVRALRLATLPRRAGL
jgi:hypothetical protein